MRLGEVPGRLETPTAYLSAMWRIIGFVVWSLAVMGVTAAAVQAEPLTGRARAVSTDTIKIGETRIRLYGVYAADDGQTCLDRAGARYDCGAKAIAALSELLAHGDAVCEQKDTDRFMRIVAICRVADIDIGGELVRQGWAVALRRDSTMYVELEDEARYSRSGMWTGSFAMPWHWRALERARKH